MNERFITIEAAYVSALFETGDLVGKIATYMIGVTRLEVTGLEKIGGRYYIHHRKSAVGVHVAANERLYISDAQATIQATPLDTLTRAYTSNRDLYAAFDIYPPSSRQAGRMVDEEAGELREALNAGDDPFSVGAEIADVLYTLMGVAHACGFSLEDIAGFVDRKCSINDEKRPDNGYALNEKGKIAKVQP